MDNCKNCNANPIACEYCTYKDNPVHEENYNDNIIYYNSERYDNKSKKICPICKKIYTDYPAISRKDNKTLICSECGQKEIQEPFEELLWEYGIEVIEKK